MLSGHLEVQILGERCPENKYHFFNLFELPFFGI
jgi:hypothetical protein